MEKNSSSRFSPYSSISRLVREATIWPFIMIRVLSQSSSTLSSIWVLITTAQPWRFISSIICFNSLMA